VGYRGSRAVWPARRRSFDDDNYAGTSRRRPRA